LNLFKYARIDLPSYWVTPNSSIKLFLVSMLVSKSVTSLTYRSPNPSIELGSKLLYYAHAGPRKVVGMILHIESLS
jgi:uncharacterized membrane protein